MALGRCAVESLKGGALMLVLILFMFIPQWCCFYTREPVKRNRRLVADSGASKSGVTRKVVAKQEKQKKQE